MPALALLPSPLLGPAVWDQVVPALGNLGREAVVMPPFANSTRDSACVLDAYVAALAEDRDLVLVLHSNAGLFAPLIAELRAVVGYVFVDAGMPPLRGYVPLAPPHMLGFLADKADEKGMLPPWTHWWEPSDRDALFPDDQVRARVEREQIQLPLSYFAGALEMPTDWDNKPSAYLAFGDTYAKERAESVRRGWSVRTLPGGHLQMLVDPAGVAAALDDLLAEIGFIA